MGNLMKNWKTTAAGLGLLLVTLGRALQGEAVSWNEILTGLTGVGLLFAGDAKS